MTPTSEQDSSKKWFVHARSASLQKFKRSCLIEIPLLILMCDYEILLAFTFDFYNLQHTLHPQSRRQI